MVQRRLPSRWPLPRYLCHGTKTSPTDNVACSSPLLTAPLPPPAALDAAGITAALSTLTAAAASALRTAGAAAADAAALKAAVAAASSAAAAASAPFVWADGPLVRAMRQGDVILIDEINLADDAVLERLNSVLEPSRTLLLAEKGGATAEVIVAAEGFRLVATMNPGGDHGKRELSPALTNRFTQARLFTGPSAVTALTKPLHAGASCSSTQTVSSRCFCRSRFRLGAGALITARMRWNGRFTIHRILNL